MSLPDCVLDVHLMPDMQPSGRVAIIQSNAVILR
jgi:hypothetical protein